MIRGWLVFVALLIAPAVADACAVCFSGSDENRWAFILTTAFLTGMPLLLIGSVVGWLLLRVRRAQREDAAGLPPAPAPGGISPGSRVRP